MGVVCTGLSAGAYVYWNAHRQRFPTVEFLDEQLDFRGNESARRERMEVPDEDRFEWPVYQALWDPGDSGEPLLVIMTASQNKLFGQRFIVSVYDRAGRLRKEGIVTSWDGQIPYCLVEVRAGCEVLPAKYRNHWILAVGFVSHDEPFDAAAPLCLWAGGRDPETAADSNIEPVEWMEDYHGNQFTRGVGMLGHCPDVEVRLAERALAGRAFRWFNGSK
jgi:hypothetical protein